MTKIGTTWTRMKSVANDKKPKRITYKSQYGDYGLAGNYDRFAILNALGKYEDIGTVEEIKEWLERGEE